MYTVHFLYWYVCTKVLLSLVYAYCLKSAWVSVMQGFQSPVYLFLSLKSVYVCICYIV